jgi:hypothetical protein
VTLLLDGRAGCVAAWIWPAALVAVGLMLLLHREV